MATIVRATIHHAAALAAIHASAFPPGARWGPDAMVLQLDQPGAFGLIDPDGAMLLARVAADQAEILTLAVAPPIRRQGSARALLAQAHALAAAAGAVSMFLEVALGNAPAQALYTAAGYREVGRRPRYYADGTDAIVLALDLMPAAGSDA